MALIDDAWKELTPAGRGRLADCAKSVVPAMVDRLRGDAAAFMRRHTDGSYHFVMYEARGESGLVFWQRLHEAKPGPHWSQAVAGIGRIYEEPLLARPVRDLTRVPLAVFELLVSPRAWIFPGA